MIRAGNEARIMQWAVMCFQTQSLGAGVIFLGDDSNDQTSKGFDPND
jgi:hypothetical protein